MKESKKCPKCGNLIVDPKDGCWHCQEKERDAKKKAAKQAAIMQNENHPLSFILKSFALIILIIGIILTITISSVTDISIIVYLWTNFGFICIVSYALGEIINILHSIRKNTKK